MPAQAAEETATQRENLALQLNELADVLGDISTECDGLEKRARRTAAAVRHGRNPQGLDVETVLALLRHLEVVVERNVLRVVAAEKHVAMAAVDVQGAAGQDT